MLVTEIHAKSILSKSKVSEYTINPYIGCEHNCVYCYARFMKRFFRHKEAWGEFVDVKVNAAELLEKEISKKKIGRVWMSGICDPYQPVEKKYKLTRKCLEILVKNNWPVTIQTKSTLVLRDMDILKKSKKVEVGFTITTADEKIGEMFEPKASPIKERIDTLEKLHLAGIRTFVMIAPILPGAEGLPEKLAGKIDYAIIDRLNYNYADWLYRKNNMEYAMKDEFFIQKKKEIGGKFKKAGIDCEIIF
jgi:DNA repair photolyase